MSDTKKIKVLRRVSDGKEYNYAPEMDGLVRKGMLRLIEVEVDAKTGRYVDEIDLTKLDDDNSEKALRDAVARKWPHLAPLIDKPELCRMAINATGGQLPETSLISLPGVEPVGKDIPPEDLDEDAAPEKPAKPAKAQKADKAEKAQAKAPAKAQKPETDEPPALTEAEQKVADFADAIRKQPGREGVQEFAAKHGITVDSAAKGTMVAEAVAAFTEMQKPAEPAKK